MSSSSDLTIIQGSTFSQVLRWESPPYIYKAITAITNSAPVSITATSHGVPDGWRVAIVSVEGMVEINATNSPPYTTEYHKATYVDVNTIELNDINSSQYSTYTSGGYVQYNTPVDMTGYDARMTIKDKVGGTVLLAMTVANSMIVLDNTAKTITLTIPAATTEGFTWNTGVYDLEMVSAGGVVTRLLYGSVCLVKEVTTT